MKRAPSKISASMMCADLIHLPETLSAFENQKIDYLHIDVMDGVFVPNIGIGVDYIRSLREATDIPLDIHLMVTRPEDKFDWFGIRESDCVTIHFESTTQVQRAIERLRPYGCKVLLAINPATPLCNVEEVLDCIDGVNLLMVNPGFAGQKMVQSCMKKAERLRQILDDSGARDKIMEVDGNITFDSAKALREIGADMFVAGTSSIFTGDISDMENRIIKLRNAIK